MTTKALLVRLEAKPGREADVEQLLRDALPVVLAEPATVAWFALRLGPSSFGIFDAFPDEAGRQAHLTGGVAEALQSASDELLTVEPVIEPVDVIAEKSRG